MTERLGRIPSVEERPDFGPTQVRNLDEIKKGMLIIARGEPWEGRPHGYRAEFLVMGDIFEDDDGDLCIQLKRMGRVSMHTIYNVKLAQFGVVPRKDGFWSPVGWLEDTSKVENSTP